MSGPPSRLRSILNHITGAGGPAKTPTPAEFAQRHHIHTLSPTFFLPRAAQIEPAAEAVFHITADGKTLRRNYAELADRARGLAYYLKSKGFKRVGVLAPNTPAHLESIYGIIAAGAVTVPVNYRLKGDDLAYILDFAEVDAVIADAEYEHLLGKFLEQRPGVPVLVDVDTDGVSGPYDKAVAEGLAYDSANGSAGWYGLETAATDEDATLAIPFTSGTTSKPKGVELTHRGAYLAAMANVIESGLNVGGADSDTHRCRYLWTLPMFHAMGWCFPWAVVAVRGTNVCLRKIDYPLIWKLLREEGITHFNAAPTVNTLLCAAHEAEKLSRPVRVTVAASPPTAVLFERMTELNLHPVHVYGMTETYGPITKGYILPEWDSLGLKEKYRLMARQGHGFVTSLPIRVIRQPEEGKEDADAPLVDVARDGKEIGEICFIGNICAKGYYKDPAATKKLFAGGVLHSGDLAVWHPDGSAQILDRAKDIIISGGENISSVALEALLAMHPDVLEAAVVAVADEQWGERPKAYLTVKAARPGSAQKAPLTPKDFIAWARAQDAISRFMVPREVEIVAELPKTSTGKLQKNVLREWAKKGVPEANRLK